MRPPRTALVLTLATIAAFVLAAPANAAISDVTKLFDPAVHLVREKPKFADAVMLEAEGTPAGVDPVREAAAITHWRFIFDNQATKDSPFASVKLAYRDRGGFAAPKGNREPFLEDRRIGKAPKMTLRRAVARLRAAGFKRSFFAVTLRRPLGPQATPPLYIFTLGNDRFVAVNTKTGKATELR